MALPTVWQTNSHAHWPTRPKRGTSVAKGLSCNLREIFFPPGKLPLRYRAEKRRGHGIDGFPWSRLFSALYLRGGLPEIFFFPLRLQLRPLATLEPRLGRVGQCAWELGLPNSRKCHFWVTLAVWIYLLRKGAYIDFLYIILKHTQ